MKTDSCSYCKTHGNFPVCTCDAHRSFGITDGPACALCSNAHRRLAAMFNVILNSKGTVRCDSARGGAYSRLFEVTCEFRREFGFKESRFAIDSLKGTSAFDTNDARFKECVRRAAGALPWSCEFASRWSSKCLIWAAQRKREIANEAVERAAEAAMKTLLVECDKASQPAAINRAAEAALERLFTLG